MSNYRFSRRILTRDFYVVSLRSAGIVILCSMVGLLIGCIVAYRATEVGLSHYSRQLIGYAETFNSEIQTTLDAVNASPFPFCSDEDIARLRTIVYHGHLVKDIGRVRNNYLYCTSMSGRFPTPLEKDKPDFVSQSGKKVWLNRPLLIAPGMYGDITESGEADFVASRDTFSHLSAPPMTYTTTLTNRAQHSVFRTAGEPLIMTPEEVLQEKNVFRNHSFYLSRCSTHYAPCMVTSMTLHDAWTTNKPLIDGFFLMGSVAGAMLAITLMLQPHKRTLAAQLKRALRNNLITVVYQPIVDIRTGCVTGTEALARWTDEEGQYIPPDVFVSAAEELGFIGRLTRVVLKQIVRELGAFLRANPGFSINVNISATDLADPHFLPMLDKLLEQHNISPASISLELTERSTADHPMAISAIRKLRERGHKFYIDDFGTGYSSLAYLNELAVDAIKIDRAFTDAVGTGSLTAAIVPQILTMAQKLHVKVVVEGVERAEQSQYFANLDQEILAQGWHFGEAIPAHELLTLMESKTHA